MMAGGGGPIVIDGGEFDEEGLLPVPGFGGRRPRAHGGLGRRWRGTSGGEGVAAHAFGRRSGRFESHGKVAQHLGRRARPAAAELRRVVGFVGGSVRRVRPAVPVGKRRVAGGRNTVCGGERAVGGGALGARRRPASAGMSHFADGEHGGRRTSTGRGPRADEGPPSLRLRHHLALRWASAEGRALLGCATLR